MMEGSWASPDFRPGGNGLWDQGAQGETERDAEPILPGQFGMNPGLHQAPESIDQRQADPGMVQIGPGFVQSPEGFKKVG